MLLGARQFMDIRNDKIPPLAEWFDCGSYGSTSYGGRYFVDTGIVGLIGTTTRIETSAYWEGSTFSYGSWNNLFCAQLSDGADDTIQVRRNYTIGGLCFNKTDGSLVTMPTSPTSIILDANSLTVGQTTIVRTATNIANVNSLFIGGSKGIIYSTHQDRKKRIWHGFVGPMTVYSNGQMVANMIPLADGSGYYDTLRKITLSKTDITTV